MFTTEKHATPLSLSRSNLTNHTPQKQKKKHIAIAKQNNLLVVAKDLIAHLAVEHLVAVFQHVRLLHGLVLVVDLPDDRHCVRLGLCAESRHGRHAHNCRWALSNAAAYTHMHIHTHTRGRHGTRCRVNTHSTHTHRRARQRFIDNTAHTQTRRRRRHSKNGTRVCKKSARLQRQR